eukprot:608167-Prorocentrum_minimum.AAC.1
MRAARIHPARARIHPARARIHPACARIHRPLAEAARAEGGAHADAEVDGRQRPGGRVQVEADSTPGRGSAHVDTCAKTAFDWPLTREYARSPPSIAP